MAEAAETGDLPACMAKFVDKGSTESHRFYLARRTVLEMLRDRGYDVPAADLALTLPVFRERFGSIVDLQSLRFSSALVSDPSQTVLVIFGGTNTFKIVDIRSILGSVLGQSFTRLILVLQSEMTAPAKKATKEVHFKVELFKHMMVPEVTTETNILVCLLKIFSESLKGLSLSRISDKLKKIWITDLLTNITKHKFMPRHEILSSEEKDQLLKKYSLVEKQLPCMLESDAIARYYGLEKGQVVKITYTGDIAKGHVTYRCVV